MWVGAAPALPPTPCEPLPRPASSLTSLDQGAGVQRGAQRCHLGGLQPLWPPGGGTPGARRQRGSNRQRCGRRPRARAALWRGAQRACIPPAGGQAALGGRALCHRAPPALPGCERREAGWGRGVVGRGSVGSGGGGGAGVGLLPCCRVLLWVSKGKSCMCARLSPRHRHAGGAVDHVLPRPQVCGGGGLGAHGARPAVSGGCWVTFPAATLAHPPTHPPSTHPPTLAHPPTLNPPTHPPTIRHPTRTPAATRSSSRR